MKNVRTCPDPKGNAEACADVRSDNAGAVIFCVLYGIVYVRCYNIMNPDDMIAFRLYRLNGDIYLILFNKLYRLF